ncbi:hypothetical protein Tco_1143868 [Tanacetum coccineum]
MVAYLEKSTASAGFHQIIDFINRSHICYALTKKPEVCVSFIKQFWRTAAIVTEDNGNVKIHATVDGHSLSITEGSIRRHLNGKASDEVSTAGKKKDTASEEVPPVSTAGDTLIRKSRFDEEEPKKKSKKEIEQERLSYAEAIRLEEQMHDEQRAQIARDAEIARQWDEEERKRAMDEAKATKRLTGMILLSLDIILLKDEAKKESKKQKSLKRRSTEKIMEEEAGTQEERKEAVNEPAAKRKKSIPRKTTRKRQKLEVDTEKEELKTFLDIVPREEDPIDIESLSTKFPIVD